MRVMFQLNGKAVEVNVEPRLHLADCLRDELRQTGTHLGCEHGVCGACTVIVDGAAVRSCLMLAVQAEGCTVVTVEGLSTDDALTAFLNPPAAFVTSRVRTCLTLSEPSPAAATASTSVL
jgi:aerobic-type carbon monoxide dehydrogenase small subunit (CoxS/CutS family)